MKRKLASLAIMIAAIGGMTFAGGVNANAADAVTITDVTYGDSYVKTTTPDSIDGSVADTGNDWINSPSASSNIVSVTLSNGTEIKADTNGDGEQDGVLTLVVNGAQEDILDYKENKTVLEEGTYTFASTAAGTTTDVNGMNGFGKFMNMGGQTTQYTLSA